MVFFLNCYQITIEKLLTTVYKKPQGILDWKLGGHPGKFLIFRFKYKSQRYVIIE